MRFTVGGERARDGRSVALEGEAQHRSCSGSTIDLCSPRGVHGDTHSIIDSDLRIQHVALALVRVVCDRACGRLCTRRRTWACVSSAIVGLLLAAWRWWSSRARGGTRARVCIFSRRLRVGRVHAREVVPPPPYHPTTPSQAEALSHPRPHARFACFICFHRLVLCRTVAQSPFLSVRSEARVVC